ncbi:PP2C family protein-serine/threonine phosphatase [Blastococcus tunisiensis]|uniref:Stage II sporulation protein E (SpoIIE) n=1 Tax=Blastococcus tunisiensis TaxID=1798228 RepID=A0A1I2HRS4_9ACTN|nr:PP2C family protein-serine/threonine phosphatase [Blastococcus sp. DSM 46838]SFF32382.1 Stage II sporulation protein E (SpoIIE) [Blastococcus sp. DSM 46838]
MVHSDRRPPEDRQQSALRAAMQFADLSLEQLWMRYFSLGGHADLVDLDAHLTGLVRLPPTEADVLAHAVNERLDELIAERRVPYSRPLRTTRPTTGPLAALVDLLGAAGSSPPERLPALAASAGRTLGVEVEVHLIDHEQRSLVRVGGTAAPEAQSVDGTMAGRAFRADEILLSEREDGPRMWVPIIDGADRIGVLEVATGAAADLHDPGLRQQCTWLARMLGHLIVSMQPYGDELERLRRHRPLTTSAELIWQQLPPLTAATDDFVLAGMLEPSYRVGGDAFDYAFSETAVSLGIFDAVGHGVPAALMSAGALAGYRSARRDARGLFDQAAAIDAVVAEAFPGSAFVTGVLGEVELSSGRLRYLNAGHPPPVLLRGGKVVKQLTGGRRVPFGLDVTGVAIAEELLEPGDWLCLYTDGIAEARDASGAWFGEDRLMDFLSREIAAGQPPAETVRRLTQAVLRHQGGLLQDDATVLLARWMHVGPDRRRPG